MVLSRPTAARTLVGARRHPSQACKQAAPCHACPQVPPSRWDVDRGWPGEGAAPKRFGGFVEGAELFDPAFFALSTPEVSRRPELQAERG